MINGDADHSRPGAGDGDDPRPPRGDDATTLPTPPARDTDRRIGPYRLLESLGAGGMGEVYLAEQKTPIARRVALKVIKAGMDTREVIARFESERQALAMMNHPNVARIYDAGSTGAGRPYFVMEHVPGEPITTYCDRHQLDLAARLELFIPVCEAIHHAHQKGIIHRDIKPSNVLVAVEDGRPVPKVIDFGVAKATQRALTDKTLHTELGRLVGTPAYMSPEQAEMTGLNVDTTSDVYSLGVLMYELLVGAPPFDAEELKRAGIAEIHRIIREVEPPKPSTRVSSYGEEGTRRAARRRLEPPRWRKQLHGELDWITMRAMEKDRTRRYQSALEFAQDVRRHLAAEPVQAGPPSRIYRLRKLGRRYRGFLAATGLVVLALAVGLAVSVQMYRTSERAKRQAVFESYVANIRAAQAHLANRRAEEAQASLASCAPEHRRWEWDHVDLGLHAFIDRVTFPADTRRIALHPAGSRCAVLDRAGTVRIHDLATREAVVAVQGTYDGSDLLQFSPDGERLVVSSGADEAHDYLVTLTVVDARSGEPLQRLETGRDGLGSVAISSDGARLATSFMTTLTIEDGSTIVDSELQIWDLDTGRLSVAVGDTNANIVLGFGPDGVQLAACSVNGVVSLFDPRTGRQRRVLTDGCYYDAAFSPDGRVLAVSRFDGTVRLVDVATGRPGHAFAKGPAEVDAIGFGPRGRLLAVSYADGTISILDVETGEPRNAYVSASGSPRACFGADGTTVLSILDEGSGMDREDREVVVWDVLTGATQTLQGDGGSSLAFSPDGRTLAGGSRVSSVDDRGSSYNCAVRIWDAASGLLPTVLRGHRHWVGSVAFGADGRRIASGSFDGSFRIWDVATGTVVRARSLLPTDGPAMASVVVAYSPCGRWFAAAHGDSVHLWDAAVENRRWSRALAGDGVEGLVFDPDGRVVAACQDEGVRVWTCTDGTLRWELGGEDGGFAALAFRPDGEHVALGRRDGRVTIVSSRNGRALHAFRTDRTGLSAVAYTADGRRVVAGSRGGARLYDAATGVHLVDLTSETCEVLAFDPSGSLLAVQADERIQLLRTANPEPDVLARRAAYLTRWRVEPLVAACFEEPLSLERVLERIDGMASLGPAEKAAARRWARVRGGDPERLQRVAWRTVRRPSLPREAYAEALDLAATAVALNPLHPTFLKTKGAAHYRLGAYAEAATALARSDSMSMWLIAGGGHPTTVAFEAMALARLGRADEAREQMTRLRELMGNDYYSGDEDCRDLYREARRVLD